MKIDATQILRNAKNTFYLDFTFDVQNQTNNTTGFTLNFPNPTMNIKANNAFVSIEKLAYLNYAAGIGDDIPVVCVQTTIGTSQCLDMSANPNTALTKGFFENILWDRFFRDDPTKSFRQAYLYNKNNSENRVVCTNPMGNNYNLAFFEFDGDGTRVVTNFNGAGSQNVDTVVLTLKVELIEEIIL